MVPPQTKETDIFYQKVEFSASTIKWKEIRHHVDKDQYKKKL